MLKPGGGVTEDHHCSPEGVVGDACQTQTVPYDQDWMHTFYDDYHCQEAVLFSEEEVRHHGNYDKDCFGFQIGPNKRPPQTGDGLLHPDLVDWGQSSFIWSRDQFLDNVVLFRYQTC
jgi:hypothetical protein